MSLVGRLSLTAANTFNGPITLGAVNGGIGRLAMSDDAQLGNSANPIVLAGGVLEITASTSSSRTITSSSGGTVDVAAGSTLVYSGALGGTGALTKSGPERCNSAARHFIRPPVSGGRNAEPTGSAGSLLNVTSISVGVSATLESDI